MEASKANIFAGMSTLRAEERVKQPPSEKAKLLEAYLKKYTDDASQSKSPTRVFIVLHDCLANRRFPVSSCVIKTRNPAAGAPKKRKKKKPAAALQGFRIIDGDTTGFKDPPAKRAKAKLEETEDDEHADEGFFLWPLPTRLYRSESALCLPAS